MKLMRDFEKVMGNKENFEQILSVMSIRSQHLEGALGTESVQRPTTHDATTLRDILDKKDNEEELLERLLMEVLLMDLPAQVGEISLPNAMSNVWLRISLSLDKSKLKLFGSRPGIYGPWERTA